MKSIAKTRLVAESEDDLDRDSFFIRGLGTSICIH